MHDSGCHNLHHHAAATATIGLTSRYSTIMNIHTRTHTHNTLKNCMMWWWYQSIGFDLSCNLAAG